MKKFNHYSRFRFIVFLLALVAFDYASTKAQHNIISSSAQSINLSNWQIVKDPSPKEILQIPKDSCWRPSNSISILKNYSKGNWLVRTEIFVKDSINKKIVWGLFPQRFITAYEIYWDGIKIAQNGQIGSNRTDEKAGVFNFNLILPSHLLTIGKHTIILRISNHQNYSLWEWFYGGIIIGPYETELKNNFSSSFIAFFIIGILFIPFLFNLFLYFARKRKTEHLLFSFICLIVIFDSSASLIPHFIDGSTTIVDWQVYIYHTITVLFTILFPAFFIFMFSFSKKFIGIVVVINLMASLFFTSFLNFYSVMTLIVLIESSFIGLAALLKRLEESMIIISGLALAWIAYHFDFAFAGLATVMVICTSFSIAKQFARSEKVEKEAQLKSARLENELLKKNINPHFLLNTLTSIIAWLRKEPESAVKLVEALALEFRLINQISSLKTITMNQEVELCLTHLQIMNYRKKSNFTLETFGLIDDELIPPMIFHTLIENGLTHGYENKSNGTFTLQRNIVNYGLQYRVSNDGDYKENEYPYSSGVGFNYIKGRLEESYSGRWSFTSHQLDNGWETVIEIRSK